METIFTDDRLPDVEIRWHGGATFNIWEEGIFPGYHSENGWSNTDCFTHYGKTGSGEAPTMREAVDIAKEHFEELFGD